VKGQEDNSATCAADCNARLPTSLYPLKYEIELQPRLEPPWDIQASINITFNVIEATNRITLNMLDIIILNETVKV